MENLVNGLGWYVVFLFSTTLHEAAHAFAAKKGGDLTAYQAGHVTLDPMPHIRREPLGTVVIPILSYVLGGWMIGWASVPYDPFWADRHPRRAAWMSLAGPAANLLLVLVAAVVIRAGLAAGVLAQPDLIETTQVVRAAAPGVWNGVAVLASILFMLNLVLFVFNLLPFPPLDGSSAITLLMPPSVAARFSAVVRQPAFMYVGLFVAWQLFDQVFRPFQLFSLGLLYPGSQYQ